VAPDLFDAEVIIYTTFSDKSGGGLTQVIGFKIHCNPLMHWLEEVGWRRLVGGGWGRMP
jgi:hypothetical protein